MNASKTFAVSVLAILSTSVAGAQQVPIYQITVTERTVKAVNYQYRNGPTRLDFRGTVLLPYAKGEAVVESKAGRTDVQVKFDRLEAPTRFGSEYLTYVLWAITSEGHAKNLGEVLPDGGDHAQLQVTSDLQAFGMIVTAEPYSAVRQPSDVVVMENEIRPDTVGRIETIQAKYELLPRGQYTYVKPSELRPPEGPKVSMAQYESMVELYQAQNAVQIAQSQGADRYAAETFSKAEELLGQAQQMQARKAGRSEVVAIARQAAQTAEDARMIALKRKQDADLAAAQQAAKEAEAGRIAAERSAQQARIEASAERARLEEASADRAAAAAVATEPAPPPPPAAAPEPVTVPSRRSDEGSRRDMRISLLRELNTILAATDSPRGLVVTLPDGSFRNAELDEPSAARVSRLATALAQRGMTVRVEGYMDAPDVTADDLSYRRAAAVRMALVRNGLAPGLVTAQGLGGARPLVSNASPGGRMQNRRVEIVITGESIGTIPSWDRTYSLK
jgi:outer membrane protein OmpA-like peptidoglycan-associated protein